MSHPANPNVELTVMFYGSAVIKDWTLSAPYSHLAGGMKYKDGKLTVPIPGRYYIYQQIYWRGYRGKPIRISILLNNKVIAMAHPPVNALRRDEFTISTGGVFDLKAGDVITVAAGAPGIAYMYTHHSFFGAFLIWHAPWRIFSKYTSGFLVVLASFLDPLCQN